MQYRRASCSVFSDVYDDQCAMGLDRWSVLPARSQVELLVAACLAPLMTVNLRAPIRPEIYVTDASTSAGGLLSLRCLAA